jgi:hypothetical protein
MCCGVEMLTAATANVTFAVIAPSTQPAILSRNVGGRVAPAPQPLKAGIHERDDGVKVSARDRANIRMIVNRPPVVAAAFSSSCRPTFPGERV